MIIERKCPDVGALGKDVYEEFAFSQTVRAGNIVFFAGIAPLQGDMASIRLIGENDIAEQLRFCLKVIDALLAVEGLGREHLVSWTIYTTSITALAPAMPPIVKAWVGNHPPASSIVEVSRFFDPGQYIEIVPIAIKG